MLPKTCYNYSQKIVNNDENYLRSSGKLHFGNYFGKPNSKILVFRHVITGSARMKINCLKLGLNWH